MRGGNLGPGIAVGTPNSPSLQGPLRRRIPAGHLSCSLNGFKQKLSFECEWPPELSPENRTGLRKISEVGLQTPRVQLSPEPSTHQPLPAHSPLGPPCCSAYWRAKGRVQGARQSSHAPSCSLAQPFSGDKYLSRAECRRGHCSESYRTFSISVCVFSPHLAVYVVDR